MSLSSRGGVTSALIALQCCAPASAQPVVSGTVVAVRSSGNPVVAVVTADARLYTLDLRHSRRLTVRRGLLTAQPGPGVRRVRARRSAPRSVTLPARVIRRSSSRPVLRIKRRLTFTLPRSASVLREGQPISRSALRRGMKLRVTWTLTRRGALASTEIVIPRAHQHGAGRGPLLFADDFNGQAGSPPDPARWIQRGDGLCDDFTARACPKDANAFLDGKGQLVLRVRREPGGFKGSPFSGAFIGTFAYGTGWPPAAVPGSWPVPYRAEIRARMPDADGIWTAIWAMNVDRTTSENIWELDIAEQRMTLPTTAGCHQHRWVHGDDQQPWDGQREVSNMARNWHTYSADVTPERVEYRVDGELCGIGPGVTGRFGLLLDNIVGAPGSWGSGGAQPAHDAPGPWDMKLDYVRVTAGG